ncbi:hypothetical protein IFM89_035965, partial [Coptis chinensis]
KTCSTKNSSSFSSVNFTKSIPSRRTRHFSVWGSTQVGDAGSDDPLLKKFLVFKDAFWRFLRPHTIRGTALGSVALVSRALIENTDLIKWPLLFKALCGVFALICGSMHFVVCRVNKPYLPIAVGDLSVQSAWSLVLFVAVAGVSIVSFNFGPFITSLYCLGLFLGTIYSVPPFRMKKYLVAAFLIIATFTLRDLELATSRFLKENVFGEGGYGVVYRGNLINGTLVAVKKLLNNLGQTEKEFRVKVEAIGHNRPQKLSSTSRLFVLKELHSRCLLELDGLCGVALGFIVSEAITNIWYCNDSILLGKLY